MVLPSPMYVLPSFPAPWSPNHTLLLTLLPPRAQAGNEASWLKDNMPFFKSQAYDHNDQQFKDMLDEIDSRDDLKALLS